MSVISISPAELKRKLELGDPLVLLDVREDHERAYCAIMPQKNAMDLHIPMREIPSRVADIPGDRGPIIVYCHHGVRSMVVARWLDARSGMDLYNLDGGIDFWSAQVQPELPRY